MALNLNKMAYEKYKRRNPEQEFYDCWKRAALEIKKNGSEVAEEKEDDDMMWDDWDDFNR